MLIARRLGEPTAAAGLLDELGALDGALRLAPAPLSEAATAVLAGETFGAAGDAAFVRACREVTGGNPFLLGELLGELAAEGAEPSAERVLTLRPERVVSDVTRRLGGCRPPRPSSRARSRCSTATPSCATPSRSPDCRFRPGRARRTS